MIGVINGGKGYLSFKEKPIGSISVSGHKFIGSPVPCGIIVTRMEHIKALARDVDYINSRDATIMGSRNGHTPLYLWYSLVKKGLRGIKEDVRMCIKKAEYLAGMMKKRGVEGVMLNKWSCTVVFKAPANMELIRKWQLACSGGLCHIVVMPNINKEKMLEFLEEYLLLLK
jgi:histidine decarboxylase